MSGFARLFPAAFAAIACAPSASPTPARSEPLAATTPAPPALPEPAKPEPVASTAASDAGVSEPAPLPLPPAPASTDPEAAMFAASICAAAYLGKAVGCRSHPPFVRPEQKPDGKFLEHTGDPLLFCAIDKIFHGSFTRPGAKQAVVSFEQCKESEDAMWDSGFPGSAVLVEEIDGRWKTVGYEADVNLGLCLEDHRADGRDVLLCRSGLGAPPSGEVHYFFWLDFSRAAANKSSAASFAKVFGDLPMCGIAADGLPTGLIWLESIGMQLAELNHDGTKDLVVKIARSRVPPSKALDAKVAARCKPDSGMIELKSIMPRPKPFTLQFLSDGERFTPAPATKKLLDSWKAESPDEFNGLLGVGPPLE